MGLDERASLALSRVRIEDPLGRVRAAAWWNRLARLGLPVPLCVVHDLGQLLGAPRAGAPSLLGADPLVATALELSPEERTLLDAWAALLGRLSTTELVQQAAGTRLKDDVIAALLVKLLGDLYHRWPERRARGASDELSLDPRLYESAELVRAARSAPPWAALSLLRFLVAEELSLVTAIEQLDVDTLRLLGLLQTGVPSLGAAGSLVAPSELVDLLALFGSPEAADLADFSLELLPAIHERTREGGAQPLAIDGYATIERRGSLDALLLSELMLDDELFEQRLVSNELNYYGHVRPPEEERRLHYLLVDSSPSMRGVRQLFARGLALALAKRLLLDGEEVWFRFFDGRLHELKRVGSIDALAPLLLTWKSDRGRHYAKVFSQLSDEVAHLARTERRRTLVYFVTHGQCHIPESLVVELAAHASLYGIFILPSTAVALDYLPHLAHHQVVDEAALASRERRRMRALEIVQEVSSRGEPPKGGVMSRSRGARG
jgi:hypothetical protein